MPISKDKTFNSIDTPQIVPPNLVSEQRNLYGQDLSFNGYNTQYSTHAIHTYPAAMNPGLAKELITTYVPESGWVFDPFCGGGAVLIESLLAKRKATGVEVNPLAIKISRAKTTYISEDRINGELNRVQNMALKLLEKCDVLLDKWRAYWFKPYMVAPLAALKTSVDSINEPDLKNLFEVIFSATVRDVMLTYRGEIRLRRLTGNDYERFNPDVFLSFQKRGRIAMSRVSQLPVGCRAEIELCSVRDLTFADEAFTSIICSPPYGDDTNGIGYFQFSKNMLAWLGYEDSEIKRYRSMFMGFGTTDRYPPQSGSLLLSLEKVRERNERHYRQAVAFYGDYHDALIQMARVVKERVIIVIGNRVLSRTSFDNANITIELCKLAGLKLEHYYTRQLNKKRIANLGNDGGGTNLEHILVFAK